MDGRQQQRWLPNACRQIRRDIPPIRAEHHGDDQHPIGEGDARHHQFVMRAEQFATGKAKSHQHGRHEEQDVNEQNEGADGHRCAPVFKYDATF